MLCKFAEKCLVYKKRMKSAFWGQIANDFCEKEGFKCARRVIRDEKGLEAVPKTLLPDGTHHFKSVMDPD